MSKHFCVYIIIVLMIYHAQSAHSKKTEKDKHAILLKLRDIIATPPAESWSYRYKYTTPHELFLQEQAIPKAIVNDGYLSRLSIEKQLKRALNGENIRLYIFGESVSVGADLGPDNVQNIFHHAIANWWNATVGQVTGSYMIRKNIAIGGVLTKYFAKCWQEYLQDKEVYDIAIWEFNINDAKDPDLKTGLEFFTRSIYKKFKKLDLIFAIFYRNKGYVTNDLYRRHDVSEEIVKDNARYYDLTCLNIETFLNDTTFKDIGKNLFVKAHPSVLAHAQMALVFIRYYINVLLNIIDKWLGLSMKKHAEKSIKIPPPKYISRNTTFQAKCWTGVIPNVGQINNVHHSIFSLDINRTNDVVIETKPMNVIEERFDSLTGYYSNKTGAIFSLSVYVDDGLALPCNISVGNRQLIKDSDTKVSLFKNNIKYAETNISATNRDRALYVDNIGTVVSGLWTLFFEILKGDFLLTAVIIS